jgi:hypothetical protein
MVKVLYKVMKRFFSVKISEKKAQILTHSHYSLLLTSKNSLTSQHTGLHPVIKHFSS